MPMIQESDLEVQILGKVHTALPVVAYFLKQVNENPDFKNISKAKFPTLPNAIRRELNCDLYELDDNLWSQIERTVFQRDSIIHSDTLATPPPETFLQTLYKRKLKILLATQAQNPGHARNTELIKKTSGTTNR